MTEQGLIVSFDDLVILMMAFSGVIVLVFSLIVWIAVDYFRSKKC